MAEDRIYVGSKARVWLPAIDVTPDGEESFTPTDLSVTVTKPDGTEAAATVAEESGVPYIDFAEDELDQAGVWRAQGEDEGYLSRPVTWRVYY